MNGALIPEKGLTQRNVVNFIGPAVPGGHLKEVITLENMNVATIYQVFEDAFSNYFVRFEKRPEVHIQRWLSAGVDFSLSYGVKIDGKLVAFILHAPREDFVMNLATGVRHEFQGQGLTTLMYERIKSDLPAKGIRRMQLEVIRENHPAIRVYEKVGFRTKRKLLSWKGELGQLLPHHLPYEVKKIAFTHEHALLSHYPIAFEQDISVILIRSEMLELHELREEGKLVAFAVWDPWQMNLVQLEGKNPELVAGLLSQMKLSGEYIGMINVDEKNLIVNGALKSAGLVNYLSQYEMEMTFS